MSELKPAPSTTWDRVCSSASLPEFTRAFYEWAKSQGIEHETPRCEIPNLDKALKWARRYVSFVYSPDTLDAGDFRLAQEIRPECFPSPTERLFGINKSLVLALRANFLLRRDRTFTRLATATGLWFEAVRAQQGIADPYADIFKYLSMKYHLILLESSLGLGTERMQHLTEFFTLYQTPTTHSLGVPIWLTAHAWSCQSLVNAIQDTVSFDTSALFSAQSYYSQSDDRWTVYDAVANGQLKYPDQHGILKVRKFFENQNMDNGLLPAIKTRLNALLFWLYMCSIDNSIDPKFKFWKFRFGQIVQAISAIPECSRSEVDVELV